MANAQPKRGRNEPPPRPIIIKKVIADTHAGHHGGAWKVAYADFVTAMMAFFLLMWLLGATTEKQRKSIADYFAPTLVQKKDSNGGGSGVLQGDTLVAHDNLPTASGGNGVRADATPRVNDRKRFEDIARALKVRLESTEVLKRLIKNVRFTETREGLRIDIVDEADFSMFRIATDQLLPDARQLVTEVANVAADVPNDLIVRGHTDALPYASGGTMNNWLLSAGRAEATRQALALAGVSTSRFARIEGVADREPFNPADRFDPKNRRMSITLAWSTH
jgi:chemotaxis protein MotB